MSQLLEPPFDGRPWCVSPGLDLVIPVQRFDVAQFSWPPKSYDDIDRLIVVDLRPSSSIWKLLDCWENMSETERRLGLLRDTDWVRVTTMRSDVARARAELRLSGRIFLSEEFVDDVMRPAVEFARYPATHHSVLFRPSTWLTWDGSIRADTGGMPSWLTVVTVQHLRHLRDSRATETAGD